MSDGSRKRQQVNVLLSTYNGECYLAAQLESILSQTYPEITVYIRDDGSSDNTINIIRNFTKRYGCGDKKVVYLNDGEHKNLGYMGSFWTLLRECPEADFYAFCDQDDIWFPEKVEHGVKALEKEDKGRPLLYSSSFVYCDDKMTPTGSPASQQGSITLKDTMFYTPAFGFAILINETLRKMALSCPDLTNIPHDGWCQKIAASMGKFIYNSSQDARYRRHVTTVTYAGTDTIQKVRNWIRNDVLGVGLSEFYFVLEKFWNEYETKLNLQDYKTLSIFRGQSVTFSLYWQRLLFPKRLRPSLGGELALRLCFLLNR